MRLIVILFGLIAVSVSSIAADSKSQVFVGARIMTGKGEVIESGALVVRDGKIVAVGPSDHVAIPADAEKMDVSGKTIIPGIIDTHSHVGIGPRPGVPANQDVNEMSDPVTSGVRALDAVYPDDPGIQMALSGGVTAANIMPGSGNVIGGQTIYVKYRGKTIEEMQIKTPRTVGGLKMANGENPKRAHGGKGRAPMTRMKTFALQRAEFIKAREYMRKWDAYRAKLAEGKEAAPPEVNIDLEPLVEVLQRKRTVHFHTHRADDIRSVLRLYDEFGFDLVIQHGTESFRIASEIARRNIPVSMTIIDSPGGKAETANLIEECGRELDAAGVKVLINTDDNVTESRFLLRTASIAVRGGLTEDKALRALTSRAAEALHLDDRIGSLEPGKDADFAILSGKPFSVYTRVLQTFIEGQKVFDLGDDLQRRYQSGGFALPNAASAPKFEPIPAPAPLEAPMKVSASGKAFDSASKEFNVVAREVHTGKATLKNALIHVKDGIIESVQELGAAAPPTDLPLLSASSVTPGLIDAFSTIPLSGEFNIPADQEVDEKSDPNEADLRVLDAFNPNEPLLGFLLAQGVTTLHACPGHVNVIAGMSGIFRTVGKTADDMVVRFPQALVVNLGETPKSAYADRRPTTRMGTAALIRSAFAAASNYRQKIKAAKSPEEIETNFKNQAILQALEQKIATVIVAQRADDLNTAIRLAKDYNLRAQLGLASDAYLMADRIAETKYPVLMHPTMQRAAGSMETLNSFLGNAAVLANKSVPVAITSAFEGYVPKTRVVRYEAAVAMIHGLGFERALASITIDAAKILQIEDRYGSIEPGKVADLVLYDGHPFENTTHVTQVISAGQLAYDRANRSKVPLAQMDFHIGEPACCLY